MASNAISATNVAPFIPEMWSLIVLAAAENNLVIGDKVDRRYESELKYGDTLNVPNLSDFGDATAVNTVNDLTCISTLQNSTPIVVNYNYYKAIGLGEAEQIQDRPDFLKASLEKCGYSVSKMVDSLLALLFKGFTKTEGTEGTAWTADLLINCYQDLNANNVPDTQRAWFIDPATVTDLLKLDYFIRYDYVPEGVVTRGFQGRQIFGAPVYMTTNLNVVNTSYHAATYMHKEALALISQQAPTVFQFEWPQRFTKVVGVKSLFGIAEMRDTFGVYISTRN